MYGLLQYRFTRKKKHENNIGVIFDGHLYLKHFSKDGFFRATSAEQKQREIHLSLQINTDGVALFNSSKFSIWPVYCLINELPPKCRYISNYRQVSQISRTLNLRKKGFFFLQKSKEIQNLSV